MKKGPLSKERPFQKIVRLYSSLADLVDLGAAKWARADCCGLAVLHRDRLRVFHLDLSFVLQTVAFHKLTILFRNSVGRADSPILGGRICPIQPQFKPNSATRPLQWLKN